MTEKLWKAGERAIAARVGGERVPITGRVRGDKPDVKHEWLSIEYKHWTRLPKWLLNALDQAVKSAGDGQLPVAILHEKGRLHDNDLVVIRFKDFEEYLL